MSDYDNARILKQHHFKLSPLRSGRGKREPYVIGFDSESCQEHKTHKGRPFLYQFAHPGGRTDIIQVPMRMDPHETLTAFLDYLHEHTQRKDTEYIVVGFNLSYEWTQLFRDLPRDLIDAPEFIIDNASEPDDEFRFRIRAMNLKRYAATIEWGGTKRRIRLIDAMAYFPMSLATASQAIGVGDKIDKPQRFSCANADDPSFLRYAEQDAILTQRLGEYIVSLHQKYDVTATVSGPHFASKTFRRAYLTKGIELAHPALEQAGLDSYHGGKNGFYLHRPTILDNVHHVDIRSAYPEAMRQLPDPENSEWVFSEHHVPSAHAIWRVRGRYKACHYRCLMGRVGWLRSGYVDTTITGYELDSAIAHGEIEVDFCEGYVMTGPIGEGALVRYVDDFYAQKRDANSGAETVAAKLLLNSLYGKFFQKVAIGRVGAVDIMTGKITMTAPEQEHDYIAGGLYHPPIASLITGYVRAKIHGLEHRFQSVMTSTDGFFSRLAPPAEMLGRELGQLSSEPGRLQIWRERLYVFDPSDPHGKDCKPGCTDKHPIAALHGFRLNVDALRRLPMTAGSVYRYLADAMVTLRMSGRDFDGAHHEPGSFIELPFTISLPGRAPP